MNSVLEAEEGPCQDPFPSSGQDSTGFFWYSALTAGLEAQRQGRRSGARKAELTKAL